MSPSWPEVELGDVLQKIVGGGTPARGNPEFWEGEIPWATVKDMKEGVFKLSETQESITALGLSKSASNLIPAGTVITSTRMGLGRCFIPTRPVAINQDLKALFPSASIDSQYLLWLLVSMAGEIQNMGTGTTVSGIRLEQLRALRFLLPPLPTQRKIAAILSAYDDLIENNTRRVQVLEQMARALYREWFVEYRFPGREQAEWVEDDGGRMPQGWEWVPVPMAIELDPKTKVDKNGVNPFVPMTSLSENSMVIAPIEEKAGNSGAKFKNGDTLFARITPCLENGKTGFVAFLPSDEATAFGSTEYIVMRSRRVCPEYVYLLARQPEFRDHAQKSMSGASGRQRVKSDCFNTYFIAVPDKTTLDRFQQVTAPMFTQIFNLSQRNASLRRTRDLLLPRLVSGELDVSGLRVLGPGLGDGMTQEEQL